MLTMVEAVVAAPAVPPPKVPIAPLSEAITAFVPFVTAPFPYRGRVPGSAGSDKHFLDHIEDGRAGHISERSGSVHWEDEAYHDKQVLLYLPRGFDVRKRALIVVFFHGNNATLERDVLNRQQVAAQLAASGINAVLVAPQFAVDMPDSSAGHFWQRGHFSKFLAEAARKLSAQYHDARAADAFRQSRVVLIAYSGGYLPAAWSLTVGMVGARLQGVVLLDALYGEEDKFARWIKRHRQTSFFFSAYTDSTRTENEAFKQQLDKMHLRPRDAMPKHFRSGNIVLVDAGDGAGHDDFVTNAWVADPIADVLSRIAGYPRGAYRSGEARSP